METGAKSSRRSLWISLADAVLFYEAAATIGESVSEFLVESGRERAEIVLAVRTNFVLDQDAWNAFGARLDRDAESSHSSSS